jgi:hypothetical protein
MRFALSGLERFRGPWMPCTLPALPTLTRASVLPTTLVVVPVPCTAIVLALKVPVLIVMARVSL